MRTGMRMGCLVNTTEAPSSPAPAKVRPVRTKRPTNLYLEKDLVEPATSAAATRYNLSLSDLVNKLLRREVERKTGILKAKFARR